MKKILLNLILCFVIQSALAQQYDPLTNPLVYQAPVMQKTIVQKGIVYKTIHPDTLLKFDIYYPPGFDKKKNLPMVIFNNGVGGNQVPDWKSYQDWARLVAANGMIAVNHQSRFGKTKKDLESLLEYIRGKAELKVDNENIAIWVCSANTPTGWSVANDPKNDFIKAIVIYYGVTRPQERLVKRKDLEILVARAGLDSHTINSGLEELMANAQRADAPVEFINYPMGQHAFDCVDNTARSKEIILQTVDFLKRNLLGDNSDATAGLITNRQLWQWVLNENKTDEALTQLKIAYDTYSKKKGQYTSFNRLINESNLNELGYQMLTASRTEDAIKIFIANTEYFPNSPNAFDALGDAYQVKGDKEKTLLNAKIALEKLDKATTITPQYAKAILESAQGKINDAQNQTQPQTGTAPIYTTTGAFFALYVADLEASIKWYSEKMGMKVIMQQPKQNKFSVAVLEGGGMMVELVHNDDGKPLSVAAPAIRQTDVIHGIYKVGIVVDDLEKVLTFLKEKKIEIVMGPFPTRPNSRSNVAIKDNSGNLIMFIGK